MDRTMSREKRLRHKRDTDKKKRPTESFTVAQTLLSNNAWIIYDVVIPDQPF